MKSEILEVQGVKYPVRIFFEDRDNSSVSIGKKSINIRVPLTLGRNEQFRGILKMKAWAKQKIENSPPKKEVIKEYTDGERIVVGDKEYILSLKYKKKQSSSARMENSIIYLTISSEIPQDEQKAHISSLLSRIIAGQRLPDLKKKLHELNSLNLKANINKIFFKNMRSRWGSCSAGGNINISTRLLFAPDSTLEYVCIHELAHLIEPNHSNRFWSLVSQAMPNYKEEEHWLKQHGENLAF